MYLSLDRGHREGHVYARSRREGVCLVARQTLQTPLDLLASCDRGHDWDITENLWTGLQQWAHSKTELVSGHVDMPTCKQTCKQTFKSIGPCPT